MKLKLFLVIVLTAFSAVLVQAETAKIIRLVGAGDAKVYLEDGTELKAETGMDVPVGALIEVGANTKLFLKTFEGQITVAEAGSVFQIEVMSVTPEGKNKTTLGLKSGDLVANLDPTKRPTNDYGVRTPKGVAAARGTNYTVSFDGGEMTITVSDGVVSFSIPDLPDPISISPGETGNSSGGVTSLAAALNSTNPVVAAKIRVALQATAAAVATLSTVPGSGVTAATLTQVISTAGQASAAAGDSSVIAGVAAAAAAANPATAEAVVRDAVSASPAAAATIVASTTNSISQATGATVADTAARLSTAANNAPGATQTVNSNTVINAVENIQSGVTPLVPSGGTTGTGTTDTTEPAPEVVVPTDNIVVSPST